jgi:rhomboid family protein
MIPIKDIIPPRSRPVVATAVLACGALEFLVERSIGLRTLSALTFAANLLVLWLFADNVEDRLGRARFLAFYVLCGAAGVAAQGLTVAGPVVPALLATGAVGGVLSAYFVLYPRSRVLMLVPLPLTLVEVPALFFLGVFFLLHVPGGLGSIAPALAGFVAGGPLCLAFRRPLVW